VGESQVRCKCLDTCTRCNVLRTATVIHFVHASLHHTSPSAPTHLCLAPALLRPHQPPPRRPDAAPLRSPRKLLRRDSVHIPLQGLALGAIPNVGECYTYQHLAPRYNLHFQVDILPRTATARIIASTWFDPRCGRWLGGGYSVSPRSATVCGDMAGARVGSRRGAEERVRGIESALGCGEGAGGWWDCYRDPRGGDGCRSEAEKDVGRHGRRAVPWAGIEIRCGCCAVDVHRDTTNQAMTHYLSIPLTNTETLHFCDMGISRFSSNTCMSRSRCQLSEPMQRHCRTVLESSTFPPATSPTDHHPTSARISPHASPSIATASRSRPRNLIPIHLAQHQLCEPPPNTLALNLV
jgi:hypothetical protein